MVEPLSVTVAPVVVRAVVVWCSRFSVPVVIGSLLVY
jgi:hypothetical protein